jgi:hypothetical protein
MGQPSRVARGGVLAGVVAALAVVVACSSNGSGGSGSGCLLPDGVYTLSFTVDADSAYLCPNLNESVTVDAGTFYSSMNCTCGSGGSLSCTDMVDNSDGTHSNDTISGTVSSGSFQGTAHVLVLEPDGGIFNDCYYSVSVTM